MRRTVVAMALSGGTLFASHARAGQWEPGHATTARVDGEVTLDDRPLTDGVYERLDGDVTFTLGLGAEVGNGARAAAVGRALFYHTGGISVGYAEAFSDDSALERAVFFGAEVRPLFLTRWSADKEFGVPILDLALDSLSVGAGAYFGASEDKSFGEVSGFEGSLGLGVPLTRSANGFWFEMRATYRAGLPESNFGALFFLSLYQTWLSPIVR